MNKGTQYQLHMHIEFSHFVLSLHYFQGDYYGFGVTSTKNKGLKMDQMHKWYIIKEKRDVGNRLVRKKEEVSSRLVVAFFYWKKFIQKWN